MELKFDEVYKSLEYLINFMAGKYSARGHFALNYDDLRAEGMLVLAKIYKDNKHLNIDDFTALFKISLYNQIIVIIDKHRYAAKRGYSKSTKESEFKPEHYIDLSDVADSLGCDGFAEVYFNEYVNATRDILRNWDMPDALQLFDVLVDLPPEVCELAINESKRKSALKRQGFLVRSADVVRVTQRHLARYLGWTVDKVSAQTKLLKEVILDEIIYDVHTERNLPVYS